MQIPLVVMVPSLQYGVDSHELVEAVDVLPTLLDLWGARQTPDSGRWHLRQNAATL